MNTRDQRAAVDHIKNIIATHGKVPVLAIDGKLLFGLMRNTRRKTAIAVESINDVLSDSDVCTELGAIYTVCEYEGNIWFLIRADLVVSATPKFVAQDEVPSTKAEDLVDEDDEDDDLDDDLDARGLTRD